MRRNFTRPAAIALLLFVESIAGSATSALGAGPFVIPVVVPLTGSGSFFGQSEAGMIKLYEKRVNQSGGIHGTPVQFQFLDDQSNPQTAVQLTSNVLPAKPTVVIGSGTAASCLAMAPLVASAGPVQYCLSPAMRPATGGYSFAGYLTTENIEIGTVRYAREMGWRRIGMIATTDASGDQGVHDFAAIVDRQADRSMKLVDVERFNPTDVSVAAQVARLKAADPQLIVAFAAGTPFGTILRSLHDAGLDVPVDTSSANTTAQQLAQYASFMPSVLIANGSIFNMRNDLRPGPLKDACTELERMLKAAGMAEPGATDLLAWDVAKITVTALRALPAGATPQQLRDYLLNLHGFAGVNGLYDFRSGDQHGLTDSSSVFVQWDQKKKVMFAVSRPGGVPLKRPSRSAAAVPRAAN